MKRLSLLAFLTLGMALAIAQTTEVQVTAPPVANHITDHSVELLWTTNVLTDTEVNYGTDASNLSEHVSHAAAKQHDLTLEHLKGNTTYYFEIVNRDGNEPAKGSFTTR